MALKEKAKVAALNVNSDFEKEIDPYLTKWAALKYSGAIAVGFGFGLLVIGFVVGSVF